MKKDLTLLVLAAGMGSRFGGLKQIEPLGPNGEFIIDYSIYDAIKAGFNKVVFLIKREHYDLFRNTIGKRVESHVKVEYVFQENDNLLSLYPALKSREKPLGTGHAILCCKDKIDEDFMIINADDFYGRDAFFKASEFFNNVDNSFLIEHYGMVTYKVGNTLAKNGSVKRGICYVKDNYLQKLVESKVERKDNKIIAEPLNGEKSFEVSEDDVVSMNMLLFRPSIFKYLENDFKLFLNNNKNDLSEVEYLIPDVLFKTIKEKYADCKTIKTTAIWYGVTYKEDAIEVKEALKSLINNGEYEDNLWK